VDVYLVFSHIYDLSFQPLLNRVFHIEPSPYLIFPLTSLILL
jgi:hypothetical protein